MNVWELMGIVVGAVWLLPAVTLWRLLRINHRGTTLRAKLVMAGFMFTCSVCAFAGGLDAAWRTPRRLNLPDVLALSLWCLQAVLWGWLCRVIFAKISAESRTGTPRPRTAPTFFWQGLLISLPVTVLAFFGMASLKLDERAAEREERARAVQELQVLAQAVRSSVNDDLQRYLVAQNEWMMEMRSVSQAWAVMKFPDENLQAVIGKWERRFPELKVADLAAPQSDLLTNGRSILTGGKDLEPPEITDVPVPPEWYVRLTPEQRGLWQLLRDADSPKSSHAAIINALQTFLNTHPDREAAQIAAYLANLTDSWASNDNTLTTTETGLPLQDLVCYRLLATNSPPISNSMLYAVASRVLAHPSFAAPTLLRMAEGLTNGADPSVCAQVHWMSEYWLAQCRARAWLAPLRQLPDLASNWGSSNWASWTRGDSGEALAVCFPVTYREPAHDYKGYFVSFFPRPVVEAIFARALADHRTLIPGYATLVAAVEGSPMRLPLIPVGGTSLGSDQVTFGPPAVFNCANFELTFYLADRGLMLSAARQRALRFGWLIAAAVGTAFVGFLTARRAFFRQLRLNEMKSDFVSSVSHELRAPIASVRLMAEGLERGTITAPEKQREYFSFIVQECRRLSSLIENVLDFSRIEQGRKQYELEPTDLAALARQTVNVMETYAAEKSVALEFRLLGEPTPVELDGKAIQQALVNLIDNALKHSPNGATITVEMEFPTSHANVLLSVEDRGEGIASSEHEKIFERFYRIGSELRRETQGVGIGLSIVKHVVEAHHGRVLVRSVIGQGSRFTLELPAKPEI